MTVDDVRWDIRRKGHAWDGKGEPMQRWELTAEKFEMYEGKLFFSNNERVILLAMLLENVGIDEAVRLGNPEVWRELI